MSSEWVALELQPRGDVIEPALLERSIRHILRSDVEVFVPAVATGHKESRSVRYLLDGYVFVRRTLPDQAYFKLENSKFIQSVVVVKNRQIGPISDAEVQRMRRQTKENADQRIAVGDRVLILSGPYKNLDGQVIDDLEQEVQVYIKLRSKEDIISFPRSALKPMERSEASEFLHRAKAIGEFIQDLAQVCCLRPLDTYDVVALLEKVDRLTAWERRCCRLASYLYWYAYGLEESVQGLDFQFEQICLLDRWYRSIHQNIREMAAIRRMEAASKLGEKLRMLEDIEDFAAQFDNLHGEIEDIEDQLASLNGVVRHVIVDGMNLACRCFYAPGLSQLVRKGELNIRTGAALGFIRTIHSLRERFPAAKISVVWDGSCQRRRQLLSTYKSGRSSKTELQPQLEWLRSVLCAYGVDQVVNLDEEADDVMAAMVQGPLAGYRSVIVTTDRDLLQVCSENVTVLVPSVGHRKEIWFDPKTVEREYGVQPAQMPHLRAFTGDASDTLPRVSRVPKRILTELVQKHGTVDGIYSKNGLSGLSEANYDRLRSAEPQVRRNFQLLTLGQCTFTTTKAAPDQETFARSTIEFGLPSLSKLGLV